MYTSSLALSPPLPTSRNSLGAFGESYARAHLTGLGYRVLEANVRLKAGEIDILAEDGQTLVFVEVRTKRDTRFGTPEESIIAKKARKLVTLVYQFLLTRHDHHQDWRIDVVAIEVARDGKVSRIEVLRNAVGAEGRS